MATDNTLDRADTISQQTFKAVQQLKTRHPKGFSKNRDEHQQPNRYPGINVPDLHTHTRRWIPDSVNISPVRGQKGCGGIFPESGRPCVPGRPDYANASPTPRPNTLLRLAPHCSRGVGGKWVAVFGGWLGTSLRRGRRVLVAFISQDTRAETRNRWSIYAFIRFQSNVLVLRLRLMCVCVCGDEGRMGGVGRNVGFSCFVRDWNWPWCNWLVFIWRCWWLCEDRMLCVVEYGLFLFQTMHL